MGVKEKLIHFFRQLGKFFWILIASTTRHDIASLAGLIAFYALFSIFPLLLIVIYGVSLLVPHGSILKLLSDALAPYYPDMESARVFISANLTNLSALGERVSVISIITLIWSATSGFIAVQQAMDVVFDIHVTEQRSFVGRRLVAFGMLVLLLFIAALSAVGMAFRLHFHTHQVWLGEWYGMIHYLSRIIFPITLFATCFTFYRFLPSKPTDTTIDLIGAFIATVGVDWARNLFVFYASRVSSYAALYGGISAVMFLVLWMYIAAMIMVFGGEFAGNLMAWRTSVQEES
jgi:membrane protein